MFSCTFSRPVFSLTKSSVFVGQVWEQVTALFVHRTGGIWRGKKPAGSFCKICSYSLTSLISSSVCKTGACGFLVMRRSNPHLQKKPTQKRGLKAISKQTEHVSRLWQHEGFLLSTTLHSDKMPNPLTPLSWKRKVFPAAQKHSTPL